MALSTADPAASRVASSTDGGASLLLYAAAAGLITDTKDLLAAGVPANIADESGHTPLHRSAFGGHESVARMLISSDPAM